MVIYTYLIIALFWGVFMIHCSAVKDPDFRENIQDWLWWVTVTIMALLWPVGVLKSITIVIEKIIDAFEKES